MAKVISIHEYILKPNVAEDTFKRAIQEAQERDLFQLPGLMEVHFLQGIKGKRCDQFTAIWVYESREAWERCWGPPDQPRGKENYLENWKTWEEEILAPILDRDPDQIDYTSYELIEIERV